MTAQAKFEITPRSELDFDCSGSIPRFWFGGDPFRTRLFDAHSLLTPAGERFFINSIRACRNNISDPELEEAVKGFIFQEGQHSKQHSLFNAHLKAHGIDVDEIELRLHQVAERQRLRMPSSFAMALTAAYEHLTTIIAHAWTEHSDYFAEADPRVFSLYAWHCIEEIEHKTVCFDVMQQAAKVGYLQRVLAMIVGTINFQFQFIRMMNYLFRIDGFTFMQILGIWRLGLIWMYGKNGIFRLQVGHYFAYFLPRFHPARFGETRGCERWIKTYRETNDLIAASEALRPSRVGNQGGS